jgi:hypothetical protein
MASASESVVPSYGPIRTWFNGCVCGVLGYVLLAACAVCALTLVSWSAADPSISHSTPDPVQNMLGPIGAILADIIVQVFGLTGVLLILPPLFWSLQLITLHRLDSPRVRIVLTPIAVALLACAASSLPTIGGWPLRYGMGGVAGDQMLKLTGGLLAMLRPERASAAAGLFCFAGGLVLLAKSIGLSRADVKLIFSWPKTGFKLSPLLDRLGSMAERQNIPRIIRREPSLKMPAGRSMFQPAYVPAPFALPSAPFAGDSPARETRIHEPRLELPSEETSEIARRFAPARCEANKHAVEIETADEQWMPAETYTVPEPEPIAPGPRYAPPARQEWRSPERHAWPPVAQAPRHDPAFDDLYGRAVAIVLRDRKASKEYLQQRLAIGYMRASDIVERMEYDGILGAPIYNGMRPILMDAHGTGEV